MSNWNSYKNKTVLVTGASSGIGLALSEILADEGARLILVARSEDKLNEVADAARQKGAEAHVFTADLSIPGAALKLHDRIESANLSVDLLINNAGYGRWGLFTDFDLADYTKMIQLNIIALTELCHLLLPPMVKNGTGGIINVGSIASFNPVPYGNVYSASKSYVLMFSEALRYEFAEKGIQVMALCPGATTSNFASVASEKAEDVKLKAKEMERSSAYLSAEEVAKQCLKAFTQNRMYLITGGRNKIMHAIGRHLPRKTMLNIIGRMFKQIAG